MNIKHFDQAGKISGKTVLVRADFNVPIAGKKIKDNYKIKKGLATIQSLVEKGAKVVIVSHLGRPKKTEKAFSLKPVAEELGRFLQKKIALLDVTDLKKTKQYIAQLPMRSVVMLENIRFLKGETANAQPLAKALAGLADIFVLDGFAVAHRDAASVSGAAAYIPAYAGTLLAEEVRGLDMVLYHPKKPFVAVLGGIKMETKIPVLKNFLVKADYILVGGGIANTYMWAKGEKVGASVIDADFKKQILTLCAKKKVIMPIDFVVGQKNGKKARIVPAKQMMLKKTEGIFDIGPATIMMFASYIKKAKTIVWNGAMGNFEQRPYQYGTYSIAHVVAARSRGKAYGVAGGGETIEILKKLHILNDIDMASTGGGSMLEYMGGKKLPGLEILKK
jgi:3-phosphoglycerate kinase